MVFSFHNVFLILLSVRGIYIHTYIQTLCYKNILVSFNKEHLQNNLNAQISTETSSAAPRLRKIAI